MNNWLIITLCVVLVVNLIMTLSLIRSVPKIINMVLSQGSIPLGGKIPINLNQFYFTEEYSGLLCLDIDCIACQKLLKELYTSEKKGNLIKILFISNEKETIDYLNKYNYDKNLYEFSFITMEELFLKSKPFLFVINKNGTVMDKSVISDIKMVKQIL
ncbi:hypothetical protein R4Z10_20535 [Niallia sp. XMNu-256]|uniref:hypothetical protein n=1 Tax=Niallia sp. XMNu-256 TaxID=3082444 RepID=UPI0030CE328F